MPEIETDGEVLPWLSPGVGHDSMAQGDKVECYPILKWNWLLYQAFNKD